MYGHSLGLCDDRWTKKLFEQIRRSESEGILITGDIATGTTIVTELEWLATNLECPIYFVLGNHDFYHSNFETVYQDVHRVVREYPSLHWLTHHDAITIGASTVLLGVEGWGDASNGDFLATPVRLNDHQLIADLTGFDRPTLQRKLQNLGQQYAKQLQQKVHTVLEKQPNLKEIVIATHVPPFPESAWYMGYSGAPDWIPDFTCKFIGDLLLKLADTHPDIHWIVLCGHGHHRGSVNMRPNLVVDTGHAEYGTPSIERLIDWND